jgi:hypothetical protein
MHSLDPGDRFAKQEISLSTYREIFVRIAARIKSCSNCAVLGLRSPIVRVLSTKFLSLVAAVFNNSCNFQGKGMHIFNPPGVEFMFLFIAILFTTAWFIAFLIGLDWIGLVLVLGTQYYYFEFVVELYFMTNSMVDLF